MNINHSPHDGLVIINKGNEEVEGTWPNKLQPGIYKNMGSNSVNIIINNTRKIIPPGKVFTLRGGTLNINIPGRSALLLGKTGEPPNYLCLLYTSDAADELPQACSSRGAPSQSKKKKIRKERHDRCKIQKTRRNEEDKEEIS